MMDEHTETHRVETQADLVATFDTLLAAFGYEAVKAAWLEASGDGEHLCYCPMPHPRHHPATVG